MRPHRRTKRALQYELAATEPVWRHSPRMRDSNGCYAGGGLTRKFSTECGKLLLKLNLSSAPREILSSLAVPGSIRLFMSNKQLVISSIDRSIRDRQMPHPRFSWSKAALSAACEAGLDSQSGRAVRSQCFAYISPICLIENPSLAIQEGRRPRSSFAR